MVKEQSLSSLIKNLDDVFSEFIRLRDAEPFTGMVKCFITGQVRHWSKMDAAHLYPRQHMAVRYDEMNVHSVVPDSNRFDDEHITDYERAMYVTYSLDALTDLFLRSKSLVKFTRRELIDLIDEYKYRVKELRKKKHL